MDTHRIPMDIASVVVGAGPIASLVVLKPHATSPKTAGMPRIQKAACEVMGEPTAPGMPPTAAPAAPAPDEPPLLDALPIRMGAVEASAIGMGVNGPRRHRPMTHDLTLSLVDALGGRVKSVEIVRVEGTVFFAQVDVETATGDVAKIDARPSDALALAVRAKVPIYASSEVIRIAGCPDFGAVEKDEQAREAASFHDFVEGLTPEDFTTHDTK